MPLLTNLIPLGLLALPSISALSSSDKVASAWWTSWHASDFPVSNISWDKYTRVAYSFAETTPDVEKLDLGDNGTALLKELVGTARDNGVETALTIGGWTGSLYFSSNVATPENRTAFVKTVTSFASNYSLDGIDFDWEYPGNQGIGCNVISPNDTSNFLAFLQELRQDPVGKTLTLSAATSITPFYDETGSPSTNVSAFADVLDYVEVMNYDIWGSWTSGVGPNAPLNDSCAPSKDQQGSAVSAVKSWTEAGIPADHIVLGVAAYGHSFRVNHSAALSSNDTLNSYPGFNASDTPAGDKWDDQPGVDVCGNQEAQGGLFDLWGLIEGGYLNETGQHADGIYYRYDDCSQTPYVYNETNHVMISFDNDRSFAAKGEYISSAGLRGFAMWEAGGDYNDILLDSILQAGGYEKHRQ